MIITMIKAGIEQFIENVNRYKNRNIALIANQTSVTADAIYIWNILIREGIRIKRIFSPEHGIYATEQDQIKVDIQPQLECEVISLYGSSYNSLKPVKELLDDVDLVIFDIQDVGSRYYTYINTMALFMEAIQNIDIELFVLDRPNPLGGEKVEGPILQEEYSSFVGVFPVPVRHGMTVGELSCFYKDIKGLDLKLEVVKLKGWKREMFYKDTGLYWIPPSPNMPTEDTAYLYPGLCLLEGTNLSEGRGTTTPFKNIGAPYIDPETFAKHLNSMKIPGVYFRPVYYKPTFNKYTDEVIGGIFIHITDVHNLRPFFTGIAIIKAAYDIYKCDFEFEKGIYEFNATYPAFDLLTGSSNIRNMISRGEDIYTIQNTWKEEEESFLQSKKEYHLYD